MKVVGLGEHSVFVHELLNKTQADFGVEREETFHEHYYAHLLFILVDHLLYESQYFGHTFSWSINISI